MSASQTASELTTRDVLSQIDRRLSHTEGDGRDLRERVDGQFVESRRQTESLFAERRRWTEDQLAAVRGEIAELRRQGDVRFHWTIGLMLASWICLMSAILLR